MALSLPLSFRLHRAPPQLAEQRASSRQGRRLSRSSRLIRTPLSGDLVSRGYFSADLLIGTPPQRFSVIVDTGSTVTAIACAGCNACGPHSHPRYHPSSSHTFEPVVCEKGCARCHTVAGRGRGVCGYSVTYQEGSTHSGFLARDVLRFEPGPSCSSLSLEFGCTTAESGLFRSQQADGILGLASSQGREAESRGGRSVFDSLVSQGLVDDAFAVCIGSERGVLTLGLPRQPSSFWVAFVELHGYYGVEVRGVSYNGEPLSRSELPSSSIVDSGTTFMCAPVTCELFIPPGSAWISYPMWQVGTLTLLLARSLSFYLILSCLAIPPSLALSHPSPFLSRAWLLTLSFHNSLVLCASLSLRKALYASPSLEDSRQ
ncbi:MAG: hypothetical protein SGPRY_004917, partial [Prymnesium sp.]